MTKYNLNRFVEAQETTYPNTLKEIKNGKKQTHWMWFIFPQLKQLGFSEYNIFYGIENIEEATQYFRHPILGQRLIEISNIILNVEDKSALEILGKTDEKKLKSSMTLFSEIIDTDLVFQKVLEKYYNGNKDENTLHLLNLKYN